MPPPRGTPNPIEGPGDYDVTKIVHNDSYPAISPLSNPAPSQNKAVFIAGASRGLGIAMAKAFAQAGASHIALGARSDLSSQKDIVLAAAAAAKRAEPKVISVKIDIADQKSTEAAAALIEKEFGRLDIVVINAGIFGRAMIAESDPDEWWNTWTTNLKGPYLVSRAFLPLLLKGGDKTIVTTSSVGAHCISPGLSAYQDSKLAVLRLMEFVNVEYKDQGVTAFAIHPGNIPTDMIGGPEGVPDVLKLVFVETPELSADTIVFLTKEKRGWLGGRYINCTWDMPELMAKENDIVKSDKLKVKLSF